MFLSYFTEQPMIATPDEVGDSLHPGDHPAREAGDRALLLSNKFFDAAAARILYEERLDQFRVAEQAGFDAIMTNEHHATTLSMSHRCNIMSAFIAANTERVKILQLGNLIPLWENPVHLAEEIAMLDVLSGGRIVAGVVRGSGVEALVNDYNPAFSRERFAEGHDLILKAWTEPGPFRWEGEHYQQRVVNPWILPLQKPHPRLFVPGVTSRETIDFAAEHGYPYVILNTTISDAQRIWEIYDKKALETGYVAGPEHRGYLLKCHVAETEEKALENAKQYRWLIDTPPHSIVKPVWDAPTAFGTWESRQARLKMRGVFSTSIEAQIAAGTLICGTPDSVIPKIRALLEGTRVGSLAFWSSDGRMSQYDSLNCLRLLGEHVLPAVREIGAELGLAGPFDIDAPVSYKHSVDRANAQAAAARV
jgi:alkanesulfonate monooxygenase SsuD/methylene tetrahydromethanopterin reductase-like flavin-dependent oxidoreductase (luciferase family)